MRELETKFFDEYKRFDALCREMLGTERGVSEYIEQMEAARAEGERLVEGWRDDYYALKHLRWLRNQIAHEAGAAGCDAGDLARLKDLHGRAMKQQDPLTLLRRARQPQRRAGQGAERQSGRGTAQRAVGQSAAAQGRQSSQAAAQRAAGQTQGRQVCRTQAQSAARPRPTGQGYAGGRRRKTPSPLRVWLCAGVVALLFVLLAVYLVAGPLPG